MQVFSGVQKAGLKHGQRLRYPSAADARMLLATQVRGLRQVLRIPPSYISRVSHAEVPRRSYTCSINEEVLVERLRYLGHLARHPELPPSCFPRAQTAVVL